MAETTRPRDARRVKPSEIDEGDRVLMGIAWHGTNFEREEAVYDDELHQGGVVGTVVEALGETAREMLREDEPRYPMADLAVETDTGERYVWNVDNGYVIGPVDAPNRPSRSDVGKISGFYEPAE